MAVGRKPGPQCSDNDRADIEDGTKCLSRSPTPGPLGTTAILSTYGEGAECMLDACSRAIQLVPATLYRETGYALGDPLKDLIPNLVQTLVVLASTSASGAMTPGPFASARPGAPIGESTDLLTSLGLDFLAEPLRGRLSEMTGVVRMGIWRAHQAGTYQRANADLEIEQAAHELALAAAIFVRLILQGIVACLFNPSATGTTRGTAGSGQSSGILEAKTIDDRAAGQLVNQLRYSKLNSCLAAWVERNWKDLSKNPLLTMPRLRSRGTAAAERLGSEPRPPAPGARLSQAVPAAAVSDPPTFSTEIDLAAQAATLVAAASQGKPFCPE